MRKLHEVLGQWPLIHEVEAVETDIGGEGQERFVVLDVESRFRISLFDPDGVLHTMKIAQETPDRNVFLFRAKDFLHLAEEVLDELDPA